MRTSTYWLLFVSVFAFYGCGIALDPGTNDDGPECGDTAIEGDEECDDGNTDNGDGCDEDCVLESVCGDGEVEGVEACDDGDDNSNVTPDACRTDCTSPSCGDNVIDTDETCDDGGTNSDTVVDACRTTCEPAGCGDGVTDTDETCDDGDDNSDTVADACRTTCEPADCGDDAIDTGETCDDGDENSDTVADACRTTCEPAGCGDDVTDTGEDCDDEGESETCDDDCTSVACGDNKTNLTAGEDCDPPDGTVCDSECQLILCGNGEIDPPIEECDDGEDNSDTEPDACRTNCRDAACGDDVIDTDETCDDGSDNSDTVADACRNDCQPARCGDGVIDTDETCDDGDDNSDTEADACRTSCEPAGCGDDAVDSGEECDGGGDCFPEGHVSECTFIRTAFRMKALGLWDPVIQIPGTCGFSFADFVNLQLGGSANGDKFSSAAPPEGLDGLIDLGFTFTFADPIQQSDGGDNPATFTISDCNYLGPPPIKVPNPSPCSPTIEAEPSETVFTATTQTGAATCLEEFPDTTERTPDPVVAGANGCFASPPMNFDVILGTLATIPLQETVIAAQWSGDPTEGLVNGLIRGWLPRADAEALMLPDLVFVPPGPFTDGIGLGLCTEFDDNEGAEGFWVYFTFEAEPVLWEGGPLCGDGLLNRVAAPAQGSVRFFGTDTTVIPAGTVVATYANANGVAFTTDAEATIGSTTSGEVSVAVTSVEETVTTNTVGGSLLVAVPPIAGVSAVVVEAGGLTDGSDDQVCDPGIAAGEAGDCAPLRAACEDELVCTDDTVLNGDPCAPTCFRRAFNADDGCCPAEATDVDAFTGPATNDVDCLNRCDDGTLDSWESCDTAAGTPCDNLDCDDSDPCTIDSLVVTGTIQAVVNICVSCPAGACECRHVNRNPNRNADGCCPAVCPAPPASCNTDPDCAP